MGGEINIIQKDIANIKISIALAFPDIYEVGMSHQGMKILYHILNKQTWLAAERVFSPWIDMEKKLKQDNLSLTTLESNRPLQEFDIIGFSLQHELSYTNVLSILDLCNIPFNANKRNDSMPLIIAGGPACFNLEQIADFFYSIVIEDGD